MEVNPMKVVKWEDKVCTKCLVVLVSLLKYKSQGCQGSFRRVPSFMCEGSLGWLWLFLKFGGKWFWLSYKEWEIPYCAKQIAGNGFLSKRIGFWCLDVEMLKTKTKILQVLAEPSGYTGGTHLRVPSGPLGQFWVSQKIHWRNPILGTARSARAEIFGSPRFWPARRFSKFSKSPKTKNIIHNWLGNAKIRHVNTHTIGLWPGASDFHYT